MTEQNTVAPSEDVVALTIAEYETIAISTGARVEFDAPEFSADGITWSQVWLDTEPPAAARATVRRDGAASTVVVLWRDALPADDDWRELWERRPMPLFGAYIRREAIRHAFRDVIGTRREPGDNAPEDTTKRPEPAARDWVAEITAATSTDTLIQLWAEAREARQRTGPGEVAYKKRLAELEAEEADAWGPAAAPTPAPARRPAPRDHLPASKPSVTKRRNRKGRR